MSRPRDPDVARVLDHAKENGWSCEVRANNHYKLSKPGHKPVFMSATPGDHRTWRNAIAQMKRAEVAHNREKEATA